MTRCNNENVRLNLKSSVYNQTGQSYFQQLSAYNSMNAHLRRVLLAKSVVDTKNREYIRQKREKCKTSCRSTSLDKNITQNIIDKLAYDTEHHPCDILRMSYCDTRKHQSARCHYQDHWNTGCSQIHLHTHRTCPAESQNRNSRGNSKKSSSPSPNRKSSYWSERHKKCFEDPSFFQEKQKHTGRISRIESKLRQVEAPRLRKCRYEDQDVCYNYPSSFESSSDASCTGTPRREENNHSDAESFVRRKSKTDFGCQDAYDVSVKIKRITSNGEEDAKYTQFAYDVTKEIMQNALYTDKELRTVFRKHLQKNTGILNKTRMLQEIHRLKISLNVLDDDDDEDEEDDDNEDDEFITMKPPTPPKVLDENKILSKLESYQKLKEYMKKSSNVTTGSSKNVVLVDANPDLLVTERDVLLILMEMNLTPEQAENICRKLQYLSRDTSLIDTVQVEAESHYPRRSKSVEREDSIVEDDLNNYQSFEKSGSRTIALESSTMNLIDKKNEMIQTEFKNSLMLRKNHRCLCNDRSISIQFCPTHPEIHNFQANDESIDTGNTARLDNIIDPSEDFLLSANDINLDKNTERTMMISKKYEIAEPIEIKNVGSEENVKFSKSKILQGDTTNIVETMLEVKEVIESSDQDKSESTRRNVDQEELIEDNVEILEDISENLISSKTDIIESIQEDSAANGYTETFSSHGIVGETFEAKDVEIDNYIDEKFENDDDDIVANDEKESSHVSVDNKEQDSTGAETRDTYKKEEETDNITKDSNKVSEPKNLTEDHLEGNKSPAQESISSIETLTRNMTQEDPSSSKDCSNCLKKIKKSWKRTKPIIVTPITESPDPDATTSPAKLPRKSNLKDPKKLTAAPRNSKNWRNRSSDNGSVDLPRSINLSNRNKKSHSQRIVSHRKRLSKAETDSTSTLETSSERQESPKNDIFSRKEGRDSNSSDVLWASRSAKDLYMIKYRNSVMLSESSSQEDDMENDDTEQTKKI